MNYYKISTIQIFHNTVIPLYSYNFVRTSSLQKLDIHVLDLTYCMFCNYRDVFLVQVLYFKWPWTLSTKQEYWKAIATYALGKILYVVSGSVEIKGSFLPSYEEKVRFNLKNIVLWILRGSPEYIEFSVRLLFPLPFKFTHNSLYLRFGPPDLVRWEVVCTQWVVWDNWLTGGFHEF